MALKTGATNLRFWGKIYGTEKDYYIAEGKAEAEQDPDNPDEDKGPTFEPRGTGINEFAYWVTDSSLSEWKSLPDLLPGDVRATRMIKVLFTGNLERDIITNPYFFGKEKHYLRA